MPFVLALLLCPFLLNTASTPSQAASAPSSGMVIYQLVMLKKGPAAARAGTTEGQKVVQQHVAHIYKLGADGTSAVAGPFLDAGDIQGILIVKAATQEEAHEIEAADPAVKAGIFTADVAPFMTPAASFGKWAEMGKFETVYFGFLNSGPNRGQDPETAARLQTEHLAYMEGQHKEGKLILAGPFTNAGTRRGIVVYRTATGEEARARAEGDPMVKVGRLTVDLHPWQVPQGALPPSR